MNEFSTIVEQFKHKGYIIAKGLDARHYYNSRGGYVHYPLDYAKTWQLDLKNYCHKKCGIAQSERCKLAQSPMFSKKSIAFSITNFKKVA